ncbi:MAG: flagellar filament capping protein FliD [bacterium]|nr:flagellar filament capping protein FliD [bacterium]
MATTSSSSISSSLSAMIQTYRTKLEEPLTLLRAKKSIIQSTNSVLSTLLSKLNTLKSQAANIKNTTTTTNFFNSKSATSSDDTVLTASVDSSAALGKYNTTISQLAKNSIQISDKFTNTTTDIWGNLSLGAGTYKFNVLTEGVASPNIAVSVSASDTNETILTNMATAINTAQSSTQASDRFTSTETDIWEDLDLDGDEAYGEATEDAGTYKFKVLVEGVASSDISVAVSASDTNDTIMDNMVAAINAADSRVTATVTHPTSSTSRITVMSKETGNDYTVTLEDVTGNLVGNSSHNTTGLNKTTQKTDTAGGSGYTDSGVTATVIHPTSDTSRLTIMSEETGNDYTVTLQDVTGNLIGDGAPNTTGLNRITLKSDTEGGYVYAESELNSKFTINTESMERQSNTVADAVTGVTLNLIKVQATPTVTITVGSDTESVKSEVQTFLSAYNDVISYLDDVTKTRKLVGEGEDGENAEYDKGPLSSYSVYRTLYSNLRRYMSQIVSGVANTGYEQLPQIGITADSSGNYSISDVNKFDNALANKSSNVSELFQLANNGKAVKIYDYIDNYVKSGGYVEKSKTSETNKDKYLDDRITSLQSRIDKRVAAYTNQLAQMQQMMSKYQSQYLSMQSFLSSQ